MFADRLSEKTKMLPHYLDFLVGEIRILKKLPVTVVDAAFILPSLWCTASLFHDIQPISGSTRNKGGDIADTDKSTIRIWGTRKRQAITLPQNLVRDHERCPLQCSAMASVEDFFFGLFPNWAKNLFDRFPDSVVFFRQSESHKLFEDVLSSPL